MLIQKHGSRPWQKSLWQHVELLGWSEAWASINGIEALLLAKNVLQTVANPSRGAGGLWQGLAVY